MYELPFEKMKREILFKRQAETDSKYGKDPYKRAIQELIDFGVVNIDKPRGPTSHQVSAYAQKILKVSKGGHSGTIDPNVTGVLPIAFERATRIVQVLLTAGKEYVAIMHLHKPVDEKVLREVIQNDFVGKIKQLPPIKSAIKRQWRFRKIYYIDVLEIDGQDVLLKIGCQAGTYIRKLCLHYNTEILSEKGCILAKDFYSNPQKIYSCKNGKMIEKNPSATQQVHSPSKLIEITTSSGVKFAVTGDHELLGSFKDGYKMVEAKKLKKGDYLVKSLKFPDMTKEYIVSDLLDDRFLISQQDIKQKCKQAFIKKYGSIRAMNRILKFDRKAFLSKSQNAITIKHLKLSGIYESIKDKIHSFKTEKGTIINFTGLNSKIFYLLGLIASDGNNTKEKNTIRYTRLKFHNKNEELIDMFLKNYKELFPNIHISKKRMTSDLFELDTTNSFFATIAASLGIKSPHKYSDILPILYVNKEFIKSFIRGYFDGDGTCYFKKKTKILGHYTTINLFSVNYTTAKRLHQMLLKLEIPNKIFSKNLDSIKKELKMYIVSIESLAAKKKFIKEIGTNHPNKKEIFVKIMQLESEDIDNHYLVGLHYKENIRESRKKLYRMGGNLWRVLSGQMPITKGFYKKASRIIKLPLLDDFIIERIKGIRSVSSNGFVYDLTVPETHNFLIETGFVSSNCHDIGAKLGCGAHMAELRRTKAGGFDESTLVTLQDLADAFYYYEKENNETYLRHCIHPVEDAVLHIAKVWVLDSAVNSLCHGTNLKVPGIAKLHTEIQVDDVVAVMTLKDELVAVGVAKMISKDIMKEEKGVAVEINKVFMEPTVYPRMDK